MKGLRLQKILQHLFSVLGEDGFGVELDAVDGQFAVGEAHDFAFGGFGGDFEAGGRVSRLTMREW